jgi:hypothetical protein
MPTGAGNGKVLTSNASGVASWQNTIGGSGSAGYIPKFSSNLTLDNSVIYQSGSNIRIGGTTNTHTLNLTNSTADDVLRLVGPDGFYGHGAKINFGDSDYAYIEEDVDDALTIYGSGRTAIMGGSVGIGTTSPAIGAELHVSGDILSNTISTGLGYTEVYMMNQNVRTSDAVTFATVNTGVGANELYAMNQNVRTSDAVTFATVNTGQGTNELYDMNQNVMTTSNPTFNRVYLSDYGTALGGFHVGGTSDPGTDNLYVDGYVGIGAAPTASYRLHANGGISATTLNTGQGNNDLYDMNQNVLTSSAVTFSTVNTGMGATEVYNMNQNVRSSDNVDFNQLSVGTTFSTHKAVIANTAADDVLRLMGPDGGGLYYGARLNFGDGDYVYLEEDADDKLYVYASNRTAIMGGNVGIGTGTPSYRLDVAGTCHASSFPTSSDARLKTNVQQLTGVLDKIDKVRGVSFDWNSKYETMGRSTGHREIGVIAQEIENVFPELVSTWGDDDYRAVDYGRMTGILIEAIKELRAENRNLQERIEALENSK